MDAQTAYRKGYEASRRSISCDMDAAEYRFTRRYGLENVDAWVAGLTDYASNN